MWEDALMFRERKPLGKRPSNVFLRLKQYAEITTKVI